MAPKPKLEQERRRQRLLKVAAAALPEALREDHDLTVILKAMSAMVIQAMTELAEPPPGYTIEAEYMNDGESPDAAGVGGCPPSKYWTEYCWKNRDQGDGGLNFTTPALACADAWTDQELLAEEREAVQEGEGP